MHPNELTLNDYTDRALAGAARADVERHLDGCDACRGLVEDLTALRRAAGALPPIDPPPAAWSRIEHAIRNDAPASEPAVRRDVWAPSRAQLGWLGIAATVILATVIGVWMGPFGSGTSTAPTDAATMAADVSANPVETVESEMRLAEEHYTKAITGLEQIASEGEGALDSDTAATLQKSLAVVDQAIDESRAAVRTEPTNESAQMSLMENFSTKITLLQDTVALINEMRKGNDAGAAQIVSGLK